QVLIETARQIQTNGFYREALLEQERKLTALGFGAPSRGLDRVWDAIDDLGVRTIMSDGVAALDGGASRLERAEAQRALVITVIALKRYQLQYGHLPQDLNALVPEFLRAATRDPIDGKPLRYQPSPDGTFLLYSVGKDGKDDGGDASPATGSGPGPWGHG